MKQNFLTFGEVDFAIDIMDINLSYIMTSL